MRKIDARTSEAKTELLQLREQLSPSGNIVSPKGRELTERVFGKPLAPTEVVERICDRVRREGVSALRHFSSELDGFELTHAPINVDSRRLQEAHESASPEFLNAVRRIRKNIEAFQSMILHQSVTVLPSPGVRLDQRYRPLRRIGVCVPGGAAAYPSTVLMTVVPAQVAGVQEIVVVSPPTQFGAFNPDILATCYELGVQKVYPMGGAQAVAALAYGVEELAAVDKIVGPGNLFVALAKKYVFGDVDIDSIAGPSEVVVLADETTDPAFAAADILAQAEHSPGASLLISWTEDFVDQVELELDRQLALLSRSELTLDSLSAFGAIILVRDIDQAIELTDWLAPEHLHIACRDPRLISERIRNAGATFIGPFSPVAVGDYAAGPSHVLPTGGTARWASGLSCNSFLRSSSVIEYSQEALAEIAREVALVAEKEGLTAHRESVMVRVRGDENQKA